MIDRDMADASVAQLSMDRRFATAYNATLKLATIALHASGYRTTGSAHHWTTFRALPCIMGQASQARGDFLDSCRSKRNATDYDRAGQISDHDFQEILEEARDFRKDLGAWLEENYPDLVPKGLE